jgi:hypothetical protein
LIDFEKHEAWITGFGSSAREASQSRALFRYRRQLRGFQRLIAYPNSSVCEEDRVPCKRT